MFVEYSGSSVLNSPGPLLGQTGRLSRTPDGTGKQQAASSRPRRIRAAIIVKDGEHYNVRQIGTRDYGGLRGTPA